MLDVGSSELLLIIIVAIVVIGPKDLPRVLYKLGQVLGKGRAMTRHFRAGIDEMIRHAELEEMEKKWAADNARIMAQTQEAGPAAGTEVPALPAPEPGTEHHFRAEPAPIPEEAPAFQVDPTQVEAVPPGARPVKNEDGSPA